MTAIRAVRPLCRADIVGPERAFAEFMRDTAELRRVFASVIARHTALRNGPVIVRQEDGRLCVEPIELPDALRYLQEQLDDHLRNAAVPYFGWP